MAVIKQYMSNTTLANNTVKWIHIGSGAVMLLSFFLPWVAWQDVKVSGYDLPAGKFFYLSETHFKLGNPFPEFEFSFYVFWLIPLLVTLTAILVLRKKKAALPAFTAGAMTLSLVTAYYLFTNTLVDLGVGKNALSMMQPAAFAAAIATILFILTSLPLRIWLIKFGWVIIGPVIAFATYKLGEKYVMAETFTRTEQIKAEHTVTANDLIREFAANDTAANNKYREKIIVVNGTATKVEQGSDSTTTIQLADSTGSYVVFSFDKDQWEEVKNINTGDTVSLKGSCSGSIYSEILGITFISFKRSTINKN